MLRKLVIKSLAPFRWAIRFELERRRGMDVRDLESELQRQALADTANFIQQNLMQVDSMDSELDILTRGIKLAIINKVYTLNLASFPGAP